jgi:hypothetical protein
MILRQRLENIQREKKKKMFSIASDIYSINRKYFINEKRCSLFNYHLSAMKLKLHPFQ